MQQNSTESGVTGQNQGTQVTNENPNNINQPSNTKADSYGDDDDDFDFEALDDKTKSFVKKLRNENAKRRNQNNNLRTELDEIRQSMSGQEGQRGKKAQGNDDGSEDPVNEELQGMSQQYEAHVEQMGLENQVLGLAVENGIGKQNVDYFRFRVFQALEKLEDGEEFSDDDLMDIVQDVQRHGAPATYQNSSVSGGKTPPPSGQEGVTLAQFSKMKMSEKSDLRQKSPDLYQSLMKQAKDKRLFV